MKSDLKLSLKCSDLKEGALFDYVVVGTGPISGPVIRRLVDAGRTVLVLEKGPYFFTQHHQIRKRKAMNLTMNLQKV
jgi:choline dehydrogenase-like flavoprotein